MDAPEWAATRDEEVARFHAMGTFHKCSLPKGAKVMSPLWVLVAKCNSEGVLSRRRARLVVRGFAQRFGVDYGNVYAHVLRSDSLPILLALAALEDWDVHCLDVVAAFLNVRVEEEL